MIIQTHCISPRLALQLIQLILIQKYHYRADKSTIFGTRGLLELTFSSGRGAMLKFYRTGVKGKKTKWPPFSAEYYLYYLEMHSLGYLLYNLNIKLLKKIFNKTLILTKIKFIAIAVCACWDNWHFVY